MASIILLPSGKYRAQLFVFGIRDSKVFRKKREAQEWAATREHELRDMKGKSPAEKYTLGDVLKRYAKEVSPSKRGRRWEEIRITAMLDMFPSGEFVGNITPETIGKFRDARLKQVSPGTMLREMGLLSAIFETARVEWGQIDKNPVFDVRKPKAPAHRDVVITRRQIYLMLKTMGHSPSGRVKSVSGAVAVIFLLALRTV